MNKREWERERVCVCVCEKVLIEKTNGKHCEMYRIVAFDNAIGNNVGWGRSREEINDNKDKEETMRDFRNTEDMERGERENEKR